MSTENQLLRTTKWYEEKSSEVGAAPLRLAAGSRCGELRPPQQKWCGVRPPQGRSCGELRRKPTFCEKLYSSFRQFHTFSIIFRILVGQFQIFSHHRLGCAKIKSFLSIFNSKLVNSHSETCFLFTKFIIKTGKNVKTDQFNSHV